MNINEKLMNIQSELKVPKNLYNSFGKYAYRNTETILEGLKPLLVKHKVIINISDEVVLIGERYYIKATATIIDIDKGEKLSATAYAREDENKKGMDLSQLSGSTSSYARKYALNGLLAIDDTKDSDSEELNTQAITNTNNYNKGTTKQPAKPKGSNLASDKQVEFINSLMKQKKYSTTDMIAHTKETYNKNSSKELTPKEASEIIKMLNEIK